MSRVYREFMRYPQTDYGPEWIGAPSLWDGSATMDNIGTLGEGIVTGILDSGINMDNASFADIGGDGYDHTNPRGKFFGVCDPDSEVYDPAFTCNDKLIGAWDYVDDLAADEDNGPEDEDGHGSHTASTTAGNVVIDATAQTDVFVYVGNISGVAPHANIIAYDICADEGCFGAAILAAIEQATIDEVDTINYSVGGGAADPWAQPDDLAFLSASATGITIATSAGNSGPGAFTVGSPANAPWLFSVGASTADRDASKMLMNLTGGDTEPPADMTGKGLTDGFGPAPIVYAGDYDDALCLEPFAAGTFSGEIVVCDRGVIGRVDKGVHALAGGAGGMILANTSMAQGLNNDLHVLPAIHIAADVAEGLRTWLASGEGHQGTITAAIIDANPVYGDIMASFSSRGPNVGVLDIIKPDITAPGVDIFAAYRDPEDFNIISGTSMSSPHVAGAVTLMTALYPDWTPAEIKSAIMTTALTQNLLKEDGVTPSDPFDRGAGRVDLTKAALAGFTLDVTADEFLAADPFFGGDPKALNLPSLGNASCISSCSWTRTLDSTMDADVTWTVTTTAPDGVSLTVEPSSFTLNAGGSQEITITADVSGAELDTWVFGEVDFAPDSGDTVDAHFPMAVYAAAAQIQNFSIETRRNQGTVAFADAGTAISLTGATATVYSSAPNIQELEVEQDPTNDTPYDLDNGGVVWQLVDVTAAAKLLGVTTSNSTAPDLDLFVGFDANGDGLPQESEELCSSTTGTADEFCQLSAPFEAGQYWILVQNWDSSDAEIDTFTLSVSLIDETDTGPISASVPDSIQGGEPFDVAISWNIPELSAGDIYFGVMELSDSDGVVLTSADVTLTRLADDVTLTASDEVVEPGDTVTYAINVQPEVTLDGDTVVYNFAATLPDGLTYVDGSAAIPPTSVDGNTIRWDGIPVSTLRDYVQSNSASDPMCDTGFGGYVDLEGFGIGVREGIDGDSFVLNIDDFYGGTDPYFFYGASYDAVYVTADGFLTVDENVGATPGVNADMPDAAAPNGLMAPFWRDLVVTYDADANTGVSIAGAGDGELMIVEWDDATPADGSEGSYDFEVVLTRSVDDTPGFYEIVFAYDNLTGSFTPATIGVENGDGTAAHKYAFNDAQLEDGFQVCYDWTVPTVTATFQALVGDGFNGPTEVTTSLASHRSG